MTCLNSQIYCGETCTEHWEGRQPVTYLAGPSSSGASPFQPDGGGHRSQAAEVQIGLDADRSPEELSTFHRGLLFSLLLALILPLGTQ